MNHNFRNPEDAHNLISSTLSLYQVTWLYFTHPLKRSRVGSWVVLILPFRPSRSG